MTNQPKVKFKSFSWQRMGGVCLLALGLLLVCALTGIKRGGYLQRQDAMNRWREERRAALSEVFPREAMVWKELTLAGRRVYLAEHPVSNYQFHRFILSTGYQTWAERQKHTLTWRHPEKGAKAPSWELAPEAPVRLLTQNDAISYCRWLAREREESSPYNSGHWERCWQHLGLRLPTVDELMAVSVVDKKLSEWSCQKLSDFDATASRNSAYCTAYLPDGTLQHRREADMGRSDSEATGFRLAWTAALE